mmetsp:Transcript_92627/g.299578  ORF Transcript_92627/g.299578 Transcript_92627/m.299578 type:complete len:1767 (+) Transcript_92627:166-5466(+)
MADAQRCRPVGGRRATAASDTTASAPVAGRGRHLNRRCCSAAALPALQVCAALALFGPLGTEAGGLAPTKKASFGVRARLLSDWPHTPPAAQSLEWLRDVDVQLAGSFLLEASSGALFDGSSDSSGGLSRVEGLMQSASARTFHELLVRNHYYSPRVETLRTVERRDRRMFGSACAAGAAWALLWPAGATTPTAACDAAALKQALQALVAGTAAAEGLPEEFVRSKLELVLRSGTASGVAVVYGSLSVEGYPSLTNLLQEVKSLASTSPWRVVFRHADGPVSDASPAADSLTGYGFELAIKSSEYKTHAEEKKDGEGDDGKEGGSDGADDTAAAEGDAESDIQQQERRELDGPLELDGLLFHTLLKKHESLQPHLWALKDQLEAEKDTDAILKAWEIKDLGYQATAKIKSSSTPLLQLMRLSQNFPAQVAGLARTSVPEPIRKGAQKLRRIIQEHAEVFSVNGRLVRPDHSELSLFPLVAKLQPFFVGVERLVRSGVSERVACELLKEGHGQAMPERLDWRSSYLPLPSYLVTKDKKTQRWGANLQSLMYSMMGGLAPVRLPLYTVVFVFDPAEVSDMKTAHQLLAQMPLPMALHFVLLPSAGGGSKPVASWDEAVLGAPPKWLQQAKASASDGSGDANAIDASSALAASYGFLLAGAPEGESPNGGAKRARSYMRSLAEWASSQIAEDDTRWPNTVEGIAQMKTLFSKNLPDGVDADATWQQVLQSIGQRDGCLANATKYVASLGVPVPSVLVNGKLMLKGAYDGQQSIYPMIAQEQQVFQRAVYMGKLSDDADIGGFMESQGLLAAFHPDITPDLAQQGGEEGMPGRDSNAAYLQWPADRFVQLPFLHSIERLGAVTDEGSGEGAAAGGKTPLNFFHVVVLKDLSQAYLLRAFAEHMLAPDRSALTGNKLLDVPPFASHWTLVVDTTGADEGVVELAACVHAALGLESEEDAEALNRQRLQLLKFLGLALPPVAALGRKLSASHFREICDLAISKKLDPDHHAKAKALVETTRKTGVSGNEAILAAASSVLQGREGAALWVCNGRQIVLDGGGHTVEPSHVQALELMEAQYDISSALGAAAAEQEEDEMPEHAPSEQAASQPHSKSLPEWLQDSEKALPDKVHGLVAAIRAEALSYGMNERYTQPVKIFEAAPAAMKLTIPPARPEAASPIKVYGILDPLSETAQSASAALALFGMAFNAEVNLVLNPVLRLSEYPLKRYYREVIRWPTRLADGRAVADLEGGGGLVEGSAEIALATKHTLTAAVHALPTWQVTAHEAVHDMDNLRLVDVGDGKWCDTNYMLRQIYSEGQAFVLGDDGWPVGPAKGLQIEVGRKGEQSHDDTMVMGNLGYFQVRGNPGIYEVRIKSGLSNETFELAKKQDVEVSSYITPPFQLRVQTRPGKNHKDLFEESSSPGRVAKLANDPSSGGGDGMLSGWISSLGSMFGGADAARKEDDSAVAKSNSEGEGLPTIHIFSVASGHLYEKLLSIMILSVRSTTKCPLHFWFIDNFLSPNFKKFIPLLAKKYNFGFDFVTYKWPSWLNPQKEKQRLIWAYKVLFLDVLFPMDVPKVLFIDADQVVRADVRELWDTDLKGNVYGWVPMGDTNPDTEGFRFWKQGYWKNHLGDLKYHIAALYVVDLVEFRRQSIGDSLRGIYNQLSRDPNSLSNLEQDLVNFAQHNVPIFSLPDEWLWCETWCSQEAKPKAKTIDLCQNPLTKEPKIVMAKRIISEWQTYHDDVQHFLDEVSANQTAVAGPPGQRQGLAGRAEL